MPLSQMRILVWPLFLSLMKSTLLGSVRPLLAKQDPALVDLTNQVMEDVLSLKIAPPIATGEEDVLPYDVADTNFAAGPSPK
ncbi:UNVERIFIED_CONTAM: hypothetical protein Sradi_3277100 [Sesamum radiatum]|uniref:Uncharacterized protein n=1 Tax=Sesamum radiatum TaxID=300843 RepID=A0AAW2R0L7_SESRA